MTDEFQETNRRWWDGVAALHVDSEFYDVESFRAGRNSLYQLEIDDMGPVEGKTLLHLQCHFGQDTLSWARLGATVTGLDFSEAAIEAARTLAAEVGVEAEFVASNVYEAGEALGGRQFDAIYTGGGALVWLPDLDGWAQVVASCMKPGGTFYLREFHPFSHVFDAAAGEGLQVRYPYFQPAEPQRFEDVGGSYAVAARLEHDVTYEWAHPIGEVVTAIVQAGLQIEFLHEVDYTEFKQFPFMVEEPEGVWRLPEHAESVPLIYSLRARKPEH
jgi:SAM-dependent methyltransferase